MSANYESLSATELNDIERLVTTAEAAPRGSLRPVMLSARTARRLLTQAIGIDSAMARELKLKRELTRALEENDLLSGELASLEQELGDANKRVAKAAAGRLAANE